MLGGIVAVVSYAMGMVSSALSSVAFTPSAIVVFAADKELAIYLRAGSHGPTRNNLHPFTAKARGID
ncbi:hypothetical protein VNO77_23486 [Canavalia gladiata]|uniref:Uncharacterized protein n=1 Tax=Canavalia gladiata TaxID=3824 RepID=A0AAN9QFE0_CANGL